MVNRVKVEVDKQTLNLVPNADGSPVSETTNSTFEVIVINHSREFASFQLELSTPGIESDAVVDWYRVEPEVCTKKPPGASTAFRVAVVKAPLPIYDETIDLFLHAISVEFPHLRTTQRLRLTIGKPQQPLNLVLPNKQFKAAPGDRVDIPVLLYNSSPKAIKATLVCSGLDSAWLSPQGEQTLWVEPGHPAKTAFSCKLPPDPQLLQQVLPFTIEARSKIRQHFPTEQGVLEVLPLGKVEFRCLSTDQQIPAKRALNLRVGRPHPTPALYELELKNASNTEQRVVIEAAEADCRKLHLLLPEPVTLKPGDRTALQLVSHKARPWFGQKQRFRFDITAHVLDVTTGDESDRIRALPTHHTLELHVLPIIPFGLLIAGSLLLLLLLWFALGSILAHHHQAPVNSVQLDGNASNVFSGSSDQSIFRWQVDHNYLQILNPSLRYEGNIGDNLNRAVRVLRVSPTDNNLIAVGFENGDIELWSVSGNRQKVLPNASPNEADRIFALDFTKDSNYLFSGHGSGQVHQWNLADQKVVQTISTDFAISSLAVDKAKDSPWVAIAGQYDRLELWDWKQQRTYHVPYTLNLTDKAESNQRFTLIAGQHHYIESVAIDGKLLATADNSGIISVWAFQDRQCSSSPLIKTQTQASITTATPGECRLGLLDQWVDGHDGKAIRSIAITQDEHYTYLASAGDDGRVKLWVLTLQGQRLSTLQTGKILAAYPNTKLHSVDLKISKIADRNYIFVASDAPNFHVKLYRERAYASQP